MREDERPYQGEERLPESWTEPLRDGEFRHDEMRLA